MRGGEGIHSTNESRLLFKESMKIQIDVSDFLTVYFS